MVKTSLGDEIIEDIKGTAIIGQPNVVANPSFSRNTNFWTNSALSLTITGSGLSSVGSGILYQSLNTSDVKSGTAYMARVYCDTVSGTWKLIGGTVASGLEASAAYSVSLTSGWNSVRFTAGATHRLQLKSTTEAATDTLIISPVEILK
jgi:Na+/phosphate symporter